MTITGIIPTVKGLSHTDKLLLLQVLVKELLTAEGVSEKMLLDEQPPQPEILLEEQENEEDALDLAKQVAFLKKPLEERRRIMAEQAETMKVHYEQNTDWKEWLAGDIVEY